MQMLSVQKRQQLIRQLKISSAAYWISLLVFAGSVGLFAAGYLSLTLFWVFLGALIIAQAWLASTVADWAAATNKASAIWGLGTFLLGPVGAIFMPMHALLSLRGPDGT